MTDPMGRVFEMIRDTLRQSNRTGWSEPGRSSPLDASSDRFIEEAKNVYERHASAMREKLEAQAAVIKTQGELIDILKRRSELAEKHAQHLEDHIAGCLV